MEQDLSGDTSGTYSGSDTSSTPEDYNDSTTSTSSDNDSGTYPGTNISTGSDGGIGSMYQTGNMFGNKAIYTSMRGATATNPFPESFFSQMFGAENVNYAKTMGTARVQEINDLRYNQAIGGMSNKTGANTGKQYQMGDYYIDQPTQMGTVKEVPQTGIGALLDNLPYIGTVSNMLGRNRGLPEDDPRRIAMMEEQAKSANDPTVFDRTSDFVKSILGLGPKDYGASLSIPVEGQEQVKQADVEYDAFGNIINTAFRRPKVSVSGIDSLNTYGLPRNPRLTDQAFSPSDVNKGPIGSNFPTSAPGRLSPEAMKTAREQYSIPMGQTVERDPSYEGYFSDTAFPPSLTASQNRINESSVYPYEQYADASPFSLLQGATDLFNPQIDKFLQNNINPNLEFETDYREINNELQPYMGIKYNFPTA